jgi:chemotaxis protein methyltransferase CheR
MKSIKPVTRPPLLSAFEFQELQRLFNGTAGLRFDETSMPLFQRRLASRLPLHDLSSYRDYARLLEFSESGAGEMLAALDLLTSGETYFFRHQEQLTLLSDTILPALAESLASTRRLNIWSAGCSSGEEVYTMAILLAESGLFNGWNVRILGSDLSQERIEHARQGCYFQGAFRSTDERIRARYFQKVGRIWQVGDEIRRMCQFAQLNLLSVENDPVVGRVELVLCRNVLIYLDDRARARVLTSLYERLIPGGYLLLGHSESLKSADLPLELASLHQELAFKKPARGARRGSDT